MRRSYRALPGEPGNRDPRYPMTAGLHLPRVGDALVTLDGARVGRVSAVQREMFEAETPGGRHWLSLGLIYTRDTGTVTMICDRSGIQRYLRGEA